MSVAGEPAAPELPGHDLLGPPRPLGGFAEMHGGGYEPIQMTPTYMWHTRDWRLILRLPGEIIDAHLRLDKTRGELYDLQNGP